MTDNIKVLNEFLPKAETERLGGIKIGDTLTINTDDVLNVDESAMTNAYMTNCITQTKKNIKVSLADGTITLAQGSEVYIPDGFESDGTTPKFTKVVTPTTYTQTATSSWANGPHFFHYSQNQSTHIQAILTETQCFVSDTAPTATERMIWYDTANNLMKITDNTGATWTSGISLPFCKFNIVNKVMTSIDLIFDNLGYFCNKFFVLPGLTGLAQDGKEVDGSLINREIVVERVLLSTNNISLGDQILVITPGGTSRGVCYIVPANTYTTALNPPSTTRWYNPDTNKYYIWNSTNSVWQEDPQVHVGFAYKNTADKISTFIQNTLIRIADHNEVQREISDLKTSKLDASRIQYVSAVPANPQNGVIYLIAQ